jgi:hypothetical protein
VGARNGIARVAFVAGDAGHGPVVDAADRWSKLFFEFVASAEVRVAV